MKAGHLLEVGIGNGKYVKKYKEHHITGLDLSAKMLERARTNLGEKAMLLKDDITRSSLPQESFDIVVLAHILSTCEYPNLVIEQCVQRLKAGGKLIILNHFTPNNLFLFLDFLFNPIAQLFHFSSYFRKEKLTALKGIHLDQQKTLGPFQSYQLLVFSKK